MKCIRVALAWILVCVPLGWGIGRSVMKAKPLFLPEAHAQPAPGNPGR